MSELSPAARAVLDACGTPTVDSPFRLVARGFAAAALRAAADQVVPDDYDPAPGVLSPTKEAFLDGKCARNEHIRSQLLAIADELEAQ
jgi:hypothetical protein